MTATRCPGRPASPVHFLYHILIFTSGVMGQKGIRRFEDIHCFELLRIHFALKKFSVVDIDVAVAG